MQEMILEFNRILGELRIAYAIAGAVAASIWGRPRYTSDYDVVIFVQPERAIEILKAMRHTRFRVAPSYYTRLREGRTTKVRFGKFSVDLILARTPYHGLLLERSTLVTLYSQRIRVISKEDAIVTKLKRFEPQDIIDIEGILIRQRGKLDLDYIYSASAMIPVPETHLAEFGRLVDTYYLA